VQVTGSIRFDSWRNYDAHNFETTIATGNPTPNNRTLADKSDNAVSPRGAILYRATDRVSVWGSVSRGFRAPTLNELYRQFRWRTRRSGPNGSPASRPASASPRPIA
jgi:outer membrane receptor protein involved in Fe transport